MKHAVQNDPRCPYVYPSVDFEVFIGHKAFRSHVTKAAGIEIFLRKEADSASNTEINDLDLHFLGVY